MRVSVLLLVAALVLALSAGVSAAPAAAPTPGPGAMTVYQVSNPNAAPLHTRHTFYRDGEPEPVWTFAATLAPSASERYYTLWYTALVSPFTGRVVIQADAPFTAEVVGYEYPRTPTPVATPTRTPTPTPAATAVLPVLRGAP